MTKHTHGLSVTFFDTCEACGEQSFDGIRCQECGSLSLDYLHDKVRRDLAKINRDRFEWHISDDGKSGRIAA
jgi:hypothetical protein